MQSEKLDTGLIMALRAHEESQQTAASDSDGISITLRFTGDIAAIEALGFETHMVSGDEALGVVRFRDVRALAASPNVLRMAAGRPRKPRLDTAAADIRARASSAGSASETGNGLWFHATASAGPFTSVANATGRDVIVAIIDSGIDYTHPMFLSQITAPKRTRILRIWDQGLTPAALADCPPVARLVSANTYGVEFDSTEIETALNGAPLAHKDCDGHGTHVAGIAAGGALFPVGGNATRIGVAPEASIIAVKYLDTPLRIRYRLAAGFGADVGWTARLRDALMYCLRTARDLGKPVVVNMSFGSNREAGDGLDDDARWIDGLMEPGHAPGPNNFPNGAIIVKASGNEGDIADRLVARIVVPAAGEITVPVELHDTRGALSTQWKECAQRPHDPDIGAHFWFRRAAGVKFALKLPRATAFGTNVLLGGTITVGFRPNVGAAPTLVAPSSSVHRATIDHEDPGAVPHPGPPAGSTVHRHHVHFYVEPKRSGATVSYHPGTYEIRIQAPAGTEIFATCEEDFWAAGKKVAFGIASTMADGSALPAAITVTNEFSATDTFGQHVITVAAYDETHSRNIATFSSRGPLRNYSDPAAPLAVVAKPEIAAPGVDISSAEGFDTEALLPRLPLWTAGNRFAEHGGTSMATPMVAGVIALLLDKKSDLTVDEARNFISATARAAVSPAAPPASTRAYGSGMVSALESHTAIP